MSAQLVRCPLTVKHILVECSDFNDIRDKYFVAASVEELFRTVHARHVLDFIKETHFITNYAVVKYKTLGGRGSAPNPTGELTALPSGFRGGVGLKNLTCSWPSASIFSPSVFPPMKNPGQTPCCTAEHVFVTLRRDARQNRSTVKVVYHGGLSVTDLRIQ